MDQDVTWYGAGLGPGDFVLDGDPAPPPQFSAHVYCDQTAAWIRMPRGLQIGLSPSDTVLDGDPTPPTGHSSPPQFFSADVYCGQTVALFQRIRVAAGHTA